LTFLQAFCFELAKGPAQYKILKSGYTKEKLTFLNIFSSISSVLASVACSYFMVQSQATAFNKYLARIKFVFCCLLFCFLHYFSHLSEF